MFARSIYLAKSETFTACHTGRKHANLRAIPLMLLSCSVDTPIRNSRFHLHALRLRIGLCLSSSGICSYDSSTGVFTVPSGGGGMYYFSTFHVLSHGKFARFRITVNGADACITQVDQDNSGTPSGSDNAVATCGVTRNLSDGGSWLISF